MGHTMDFMNPLVTGWYQNRHRFAVRGEQFGKNAEKFYEFVRENDLFLTHVLVAPQIDRSKTSAEQEDPFLHLGRVRETPDGIIVRGAKMLGSMAPIAEEIFVMPFGGIAPGDDAYAVTFSILLRDRCSAARAAVLLRGAPPRRGADEPLASYSLSTAE